MAIGGYEKAAIFLSIVGEETAAEIMKSLDVKEIGRISTHMSRLQSMKQTELDGLFMEIEGEISKGAVHFGGEEYVKKVLSKGLGDESAVQILELASKEDTIDALKWVDSKTLSNFLMTEHPQTIALVLCLLESAQASEVLATFPDKLKADISMRIAQTERLPKGAIDELNEVLKGQIDVGKGKSTKFIGTKAIAEILNRTDRSTEQMILENIEMQNNVLADSIRQLMFVFDDLVKLDDRGIQMILKEISTEDLSLALKTASDALKEKIFKNMSQRAAEILKEDMEVKGPVKVSDVSKAQQNIVKVTRKLEEEGKISIGGKGGEELVA